MSDQSGCETALDPNFVETIGLLNNREIPYWLCHGTLLGLIRDGRLIPWDHDIDIALWAGTLSKESLIEMMEAKGYSLKNDGADYDFVNFTKGGGREVDFNYYRTEQKSGIAFSEWFISRSRFSDLLELVSNRVERRGRWGWAVRRLYFLSPLASLMIRLLKKGGVFYKSAGYTTPAHLLKEFEMIDISGIKVRVPRSSEAVLEFVYGKDWRVPKQQYYWAKESPATRISSSRFR